MGGFSLASTRDDLDVVIGQDRRVPQKHLQRFDLSVSLELDCWKKRVSIPLAGVQLLVFIRPHDSIVLQAPVSDPLPPLLVAHEDAPSSLAAFALSQCFVTVSLSVAYAPEWHWQAVSCSGTVCPFLSPCRWGIWSLALKLTRFHRSLTQPELSLMMIDGGHHTSGGFKLAL
jgi:hypothetical protein